jgi:hypothetical protein
VPPGYFDLNAEEVLEHWQARDAIREFIANALDESAIAGTAIPTVTKLADGRWQIADTGRGLHYQHLTQKENAEKRQPRFAGRVIGRFGVGLKDALVTCHRRGIDVEIRSPHGVLSRLEARSKDGFGDVKTLHAVWSSTASSTQAGTQVLLQGVTDADVEAARGLFLRFEPRAVLESTRYGDVIAHQGSTATIYILGVKAAEEPGFLFSYNVTNLTQSMKKALNRERSAVGRDAFRDRVKAMLLECRAPAVIEPLVQDLERWDAGASHDELKWTDVSAHACRELQQQAKIVFATPAETIRSPGAIDDAASDGYRIVPIPDTVRQKIASLRTPDGQRLRTLDVYQDEWNRSFQFEFIAPKELSRREAEVYEHTDTILGFARARSKVKQVLISTKMRKEGGSETLGCWEPDSGRVIVRRDQLKGLATYAGTLLHECAHALSGRGDVDRGFEDQLTELLGRIAGELVEGRGQESKTTRAKPRRRTKRS